MIHPKTDKKISVLFVTHAQVVFFDKDELVHVHINNHYTLLCGAWNAI